MVYYEFHWYFLPVFFFFFLAMLHSRWECEILVPGPDMELAPPAVEAQDVNRRIAREVPHLHNFKYLFLYKLQVYTISLK